MPAEVPSNWLTAVRLTRLNQALCSLSGTPPGLPFGESVRVVWRTCGGPYDEILQLLTLLENLELVIVQEGTIRRTLAGDKVAKAARKGDLKPLGMILVRTGSFHDQARILIECGQVDKEGNLQCPTKLAKTGAPQLLGVLTWWDGVMTLPSVLIPKGLFSELNTVWALLPPPVETPSWVVDQKAVGDRAEMYTVQYERTRISDPSSIVWVARDSDNLGWDVEDRSVTPHRCIEVKGRRDVDVTFYFSDNEWTKAQELGPLYEVQFWGGIDLARVPAMEYAALRAAGYPLVIENFATQLAAGRWKAIPIRWRVSQRDSTNSTEIPI